MKHGHDFELLGWISRPVESPGLYELDLWNRSTCHNEGKNFARLYEFPDTDDQPSRY